MMRKLTLKSVFAPVLLSILTTGFCQPVFAGKDIDKSSPKIAEGIKPKREYRPGKPGRIDVGGHLQVEATGINPGGKPGPRVSDGSTYRDRGKSSPKIAEGARLHGRVRPQNTQRVPGNDPVFFRTGRAVGSIHSPSAPETAAQRRARVRQELFERVQLLRSAGFSPSWGGEKERNIQKPGTFRSVPAPNGLPFPVRPAPRR